MAEEKSKFDSLGEQTRAINVALKYTDNDMDKARLMVAGQYNDIRVIKGKFSIDSNYTYGIFIIFVNVANPYIVNANTIIINTKGPFDRVRIFDHWTTYFSQFEKFLRDLSDSLVESYDFTNNLIDTLQNEQMINKILNENLDTSSTIIKNIIGNFFETQSLSCQLDIEESSSLSLELEGIPMDLPAETEPARDPGRKESSADKQMGMIESQAEYVIEGKVIVSPVKGKYINTIKSGDVIKVFLLNHDEASISVARMLHAYTEDDDFLPIKTRVKALLTLDDGGYIIYGVIAKNVLVKIIEEEDVKIEVDSSDEKRASGAATRAKKNEQAQILLYVALLFGLVLITMITLYYIL